MSEATISSVRAAQHEALVLKLEALLREVRPLAVRHPDALVTPPVRIATEALLYDLLPFAPRGRRTPFPVAAPDLGGLVVQLGQALAVLDDYEVRHSTWSPKHQAYVWRLGRGHAQPVARLKPRLAQDPGVDRRDGDRMRNAVIRQINAKAAEAYERGYSDAQSGKPPAE